MTYTDRENSVHDGAPLELYQFETVEQSWHLTSADEPVEFAGHTFTPTLPLEREVIGKGAETKSGEFKLTLPRDHEIAQLFISYMPVSPLTLVIFRKHRDDSEAKVEFTGRITMGAFTQDCELTCAPDEAILQRTIPTARYQTPCNRLIYSVACGVNKEDFRTDAVVTLAMDDEVRAFEFAAKPDGWFTNGYLEFGHQRRMIIDHHGDTFKLLVGIPALKLGDSVRAYAGCARTFDACGAKFNNAANFFGFEWMPTRNPFNGLQY